MPDKNGSKRRPLALSFRDAFRGIFVSIYSERNMRIHITAAIYVILLAVFVGLPTWEIAILVLTIGAVITAECFNTAIEQLCDFCKSGYDKQIGMIKDISAGAVLITAIAAVVIAAVLFLKNDAWTSLVDKLYENPLPTVIAAALLLVCGILFVCFFGKKNK